MESQEGGGRGIGDVLNEVFARLANLEGFARAFMWKPGLQCSACGKGIDRGHGSILVIATPPEEPFDVTASKVTQKIFWNHVQCMLGQKKQGIIMP